MHRLVRREFAAVPLLSRILYRRFRFEFFRRRRFGRSPKPAYAFYDTGAEMHEYLTHVKGYEFRSVSAGAVPWSANHLGGVTRGVLNRSAPQAGVSNATESAGHKLKQEYGVTVSNLPG
jgi:hypothetical protein